MPSLANVLRLRRPMVIVDEAHNARTALSFVVLARLAPALIVEFTATPVTPHTANAAKGAFCAGCLFAWVENKQFAEIDRVIRSNLPQATFDMGAGKPR